MRTGLAAVFLLFATSSANASDQGAWACSSCYPLDSQEVETQAFIQMLADAEGFSPGDTVTIASPVFSVAATYEYQPTFSIKTANRQFSLVSNVLKTKHDTVKSQINNVR